MNFTATDSSPKPSRTYTFSSPPRALTYQHRRYQDSFGTPDEKPTRYGNIMHDRRVIRGNTYALRSYQPISHPDLVFQRQQEAKRKALARKQAREHLQPRTPDPIEGRKHVGIQTELFLEELAGHIIQEDKECQTDSFLNRPPTPLIIPVKIGYDEATEILEGELFNFDIEVKPMLKVLVGKIIEQALVEVLEEEELAEIYLEHQLFEELQNVNMALLQRLKEQDSRYQKEKENRQEQQLELDFRQKEASEKLAAHMYTRIYMADLLPYVFDNLRMSGYFYDPIEREIEIDFLPWLMNEVGKKIECNIVGRAVLDMLIGEAVKNMLNMFEQLGVKQSKNFPDEKDKERKESLKRGAEPVMKNVKQQDSKQINSPLKKKPTKKEKRWQKKEDGRK